MPVLLDLSVEILEMITIQLDLEQVLSLGSSCTLLANGEHHEAIDHTVKEFESLKKIHKKKIGKLYSPGQMFYFNFQFQCAEGWVYNSEGYEVEKKKETVFNFLLPCLKSKEKLSFQ